MNKQLYRIIFNKVRGLWVVVAENVTAKSKQTGAGNASGNARSLTVRMKGLRFSILLALGLVGTLAQAQIVADPNAPGSQRPTVGNAANGVPLVNIQTPSAAGVSRNTYTQFDVNQQGVILNNARENTQTQLGGYVQANPSLAAGAARVILNEVNTSNPSLLHGYVEVAGSRAQVVIANPSGISCNGCGFINASRATLTTGSPIMNGGRLDGYLVQGGAISITGNGLDASRVDYTDIIARAVQVNAGIWANELTVGAGANKVSADLSQITPIEGGAAAPFFGIDVAALGGMYAGKITLIGTEAGVGVRNAGKIGLSAGEVTITADGRLENTGQIDGATTHLSARTVDNLGTGSLFGDRLAITVDGRLENAGQISGASTHLSARTVDNLGTGIIFGDHLTITADGRLENTGLIDGATTHLSANTVNNLGTGSIFGDRLAIQADTLNNDVDNGVAAVIGARERLDIGAQILNNREHALIFSAGDMALGGALDANHRATGKASTINNNSASIEALGDLSLAADTIHNTNEHFSTAVEYATPEHIIEYQGSGSPNRFKPGEPGLYVYEDESDHLCTPELQACLDGKMGGGYEEWLKYDYTRTTSTTIVTESDPSNITSGGAMHIDAGTLLNDKSQIVAGGTLTGNIGTLQNTEVAGQHTITDIGTVTEYWREHKKGQDDTGWDSTAYKPPTVIQEIRLTPTVYQGNADGSDPQIVRRGDADTTSSITAPPNTTLPNNRLFSINPSGSYLIETDPRFANYRTWMSSDYMLEQMNIDPATMQKRLGDGFYEQKLIREQIAQLTGRRFLDGYANDEAQYRALIDNSLTYVERLNLIPGVALTPEQIAQLTSDIVWLVEQDITLPDGQIVKALAPQVYVRVQPGDLDGSGALIAGQNVKLNLTGDLLNQGSIAGRELVSINAENVKNLGGRITGDDVTVQARTDLDNLGGLIDAANSLTATAGRDLNVTTTTRETRNAQGALTHINRVAGLYITGPENGVLLASAGNDINLVGAQIINASANGLTALSAERNLNLATVEVSHSQSLQWDDNNWRKDSTRQEVGTDIQTRGDLVLSAGNDINARGAQVNSTQGAVLAIAGNDINLTAADRVREVDEAHQHKGRSTAYASTTTTTRDTLTEKTALSTTLSGNETTVQAGNNLNIRGSNVVADGQLALKAGGDITIEAATETFDETHLRNQKKTGLFSGGSIGFTIGTQEQSTDQQSQGATAAASTIGSTGASVTIEAGNHYRQVGSNVLAPNGDISIDAQRIDIVEAREDSQSSQETKFKQSGLTVALSSPVIALIQTAEQMKSASNKTSDGRMQALAGATTVLAAKNAVDAVSASASDAGGLNISITVGASRSQSKTTQEASMAAGSTVAAGGDVTLRARGAGEDSNLTVQGSNIKGGGDVTLQAEGDINLLASRNAIEMDRESSSASGAVGVAVSLGAGGMSFGITASASGSRGKAEGSDLAWTNTQVSAGNTLTLESGGNTNLIGAVASGERVVANVGGDLNIESLQDTSEYKSKDQSISASATVGFGFSGSVSANQQQINSDYASVHEQSAIKAGDGGFQIEVKGNTDLKGAVITSTDKAVEEGLNRLTTATLTHSNIKNRAKYSASSVGIGGGYTSENFSLAKADGSRATPATSGVGTNQQGQAATGGDKVPGSELPSYNGLSATSPSVMFASGKDSSTTASGISGGAITITDEAKQKELTGKDAEQTLASLDRSVSSDQDNTNALKPIFNEQEIQAGFEIVGALQREVGTFINNRAKETADAQKALKEELAKPESERNPEHITQLIQTISDNEIWAPGGSARMIVTALTAAAGGNVTGTGTEILQSAAVNYLQSLGAQEIKNIADGLDEVARTALHGLLACGGAAAQGQSCGTAAAGASASVVLNNLIQGLDGKKAEEMTAVEKEARINLVTSLIAGITEAAGGEAAVASSAAKIEMENNAVFALAGPSLVKALVAGGTLAMRTCLASPACVRTVGAAGGALLTKLLSDDEAGKPLTTPIPEPLPPLEGYPADLERGPWVETYPAAEEQGPSILVTPRPEVQGPSIEFYPGSQEQGPTVIMQEDATKGGTAAEQFVLNENRATKIFGARDGHILDTPANRDLITNVANNPATKLGTDKFGTTWSAQIQADGTQVWVQTRNGQVWNAGVNTTPKPFDPNTGLASPTRPGWK